MLAFSIVLIVLAVAARWLLGHRRITRHILAGSVVVVALMSVAYILINRITGAGLNNATFYHMATGLGGGDITEYAGPLVVGLLALLAAAGAAYAIIRYLDQKPVPNRYAEIGAMVCVALAFFIHPLSKDLRSHALRGFVAQETAVLGGQAGLRANGQAKNLVLIYLESFERTYFDETVFPGLATNLTALEREGVSFTNIDQAVGASFTVGGMVASQCGLPLILPSGPNSMKLENFMPGANCLGDVLAGNGYHTEFLGGASLEFAGKGAFYKTHAYSNVFGLTELLPTLEEPDYVGPWGLQDDTLYDLALERLNDLSGKDEPFALTMITLDTHHPSGHADTNRACQQMDLPRAGNGMADSVMCADIMAANFIRDVQNSPVGDDTLIVVMSDHIAMVNDLTPELDQLDRTNLFFVLNSDLPAVQNTDRHGTTLDVGPTVLSLMGIETPSLGFGVDLLGDEPTLVENNTRPGQTSHWTNDYFASFQDQQDSLWELPSLNGTVDVRLADQTVTLEGTAVKFPFVSEVSDAGRLVSLSIYDRDSDVYLGEVVDAMDAGQKILWIDECRILRYMAPDVNFGTTRYCVVSGQIGSPDLRVDRLTDDLSTSVAFLALNTDDTTARALHQARLDEMLTYLGAKPHEWSVATSRFSDRPRFVRSASMGNGPSGTFAPRGDNVITGTRTPLPRGVSVMGLTGDGDWETFLLHDQCQDIQKITDIAQAVATMEQAKSQYEFIAVAVEDSAWCEDDVRDFDFIADTLGLTQLPLIDMRQAYFGLVERTGQVREMLADGDEAFLMKLNPQIDPTLPALQNHTLATVVVQPRRMSVIPAVDDLVDLNALTANAHNGTCETPSVMPARSFLDTPLPLGATLALEGGMIEEFVNFDTGWWDAEETGRWIGKSVAHMEFILPSSDDGLSLTMKFDVFSPNARAVRVMFDGTVLHDGMIDDEGNLVMDVSALPRDTLTQLRFVFDTPVFDCPDHKYGNGDSRQLAAMLWGLTLTQSDQTPATHEMQTGLPTGGDVIALAGGAMGSRTGTNSLDALWENREVYTYFEMDLSFTFDGQLICLQDWDQAFLDRFGFSADEMLSHRTFVELLNKVDIPGPTNCTLHTLAGWLYQNNDKRIITDFQNDEIASLHELAASLPSLKERFVVKLSDPAAVEVAATLGFPDVIFDMTRNQDLMADADAMDRLASVRAFTLNQDQIAGGWAGTLKSSHGAQIYGDAASSVTAASCMMAQGADAVFADGLVASDLAAVPPSADCTPM